MRKPAIAAAVAAMLLVSAGCGTDRERGSCDEADPAVVKEIMAGARTDFRPPTSDGTPGIQIDHLDLLASGSEQLPEGSREFGADRLVAVMVSTVLGSEDASDDLGGFEDILYFAVDADGALLGPVGTYTNDLFDLRSPNDPTWLAWGDKVEDLKMAFDLFRCLQPD